MFGTAIPSAVLCVVVIVSTVVLTTIFVQYGEVDNLTNGGKNLLLSNLIIVAHICAVETKNASGTKMINFDNCERSEEKRGLQE